MMNHQTTEYPSVFAQHLALTKQALVSYAKKRSYPSAASSDDDSSASSASLPLKKRKTSIVRKQSALPLQATSAHAAMAAATATNSAAANCHSSLSSNSTHSAGSSTNYEYSSNSVVAAAAAAEDAGDSRWQFHFQQLCDYRKQHGDCLVARPHSTLGAWVNTQRVLFAKYKRGEVTTLTAERVQKLDTIGFVWDDYGKRWQDLYQELVEYKNVKGNCLVPRSYPPNPKLGRWVYTQRTRRSQNALSPERVQKLEALGFVWKIFSRSSWENCYQQLVEFKTLYGHCRVPRKYEENRKLGSWVQTQRTEMKYRRQGRPSPMTDDRVRLLNDLGFEWKVNQSRDK